MRLELRHANGATPILLGAGAWRDAGEVLEPWLEGRLLFIVTTPRVWGLHAEAVAPVASQAARTVVLEVEEGEAAKQVDVAARLWRAMLSAGGTRSSRLLAFGGGSVTDLGGFVAGCFLRGIEAGLGPTTLLAQIDAAIGGKTAVDLPEGKNSVGLLRHPPFVVCDPELLATLPDEELRSGLAEAIKVAFVASAERLAWIEDRLDGILSREPETLAVLLAASVRAKVAIVESDVEDRGARQLLNFGHTLGHAIEAALGYGGLRHGEAVIYGMLFAARLAERRGLPAGDAARLRALLGRLRPPPLPPLAAAALLELVERDKKAGASGPSWVLPERVGGARFGVAIPRAEVAVELRSWLAAPWESGA